MQALILAAALAAKPVPAPPQQSLNLPETLYQMEWGKPLSDNCKPVGMNATFDAIQMDMAQEKGNLGATVMGRYDGPTFVFFVVSMWKEDGRQKNLEEIFTSNRNYCLKNFYIYYAEALRFAKDGELRDRPGMRDFTQSAIGHPSTLNRRHWVPAKKR